MPSEFKSWLDFDRFADSVRQSARFVHEPSVRIFLRTLLATSAPRRRHINAGKFVWRAQVGYATEIRRQDDVEWEEHAPYSGERMKPLLRYAHEGRVNPKGIPCLYTASDRDTAISEVRPAIGSRVSVGMFRLEQEVTLVDFSVGHDSQRDFYLDEPDPVERERYIWSSVDREFSEPVSAEPGLAEYVPTQVIAEYFKKKRFDGVVYKSRLGRGFNIALFNPTLATQVNCFRIPVTAVSLTFGESESEYHVRPPPSAA
jgi:hypothetical protein